MPLVSKQQARFMYAHQDDPGRLGTVAKEFIQASPHGKGAYKGLPKRVKGSKSTRAKTMRRFGTLAME
jgi:hypothetical protein